VASRGIQCAQGQAYLVTINEGARRVCAKEKDRKLVGIIVVRNDSPYRNVSQLSGQVIASRAALAFAASVLTRDYLPSQGVNISPWYVTSHHYRIPDRRQRSYPAGGGIAQTLEKEVRAAVTNLHGACLR